MSQNESQWNPKLWGISGGLLAFSAAMLVGIAADLEPDTILQRALACAAAAAVVAIALANLAGLAPQTGEDE